MQNNIHFTVQNVRRFDYYKKKKKISNHINYSFERKKIAMEEKLSFAKWLSSRSTNKIVHMQISRILFYIKKKVFFFSSFSASGSSFSRFHLSSAKERKSKLITYFLEVNGEFWISILIKQKKKKNYYDECGINGLFHWQLVSMTYMQFLCTTNK